MDYGKTAYMKVYDLESRINSTTSVTKSNRTGATHLPYFDFTAGEYECGELSASGNVTVIVKAEVRADSGAEKGKIMLKIGGIVACTGAERRLEKGETYDFLLISAITLNGSSTVSLSSSNADCTLVSCQIVAIGENVSLSHTGGDCAVDKCGSGEWLAVASEDNDVTAYIFTEQDPADFGDPLYIGTGKHADCVGGESSFVVVYVDGVGNGYAVWIEPSGAVVKTEYIASGLSAIAIGRCGNGYITAELDSNGAVLCRYISEGGGISMPFDVGITDHVVRIGFVKNADRPTLIVGTRDRSYIKYIAIDYGKTDVFAYSASIGIEETTA